jgi:hypothetical protein
VAKLEEEFDFEAECRLKAFGKSENVRTTIWAPTW